MNSVLWIKFIMIGIVVTAMRRADGDPLVDRDAFGLEEELVRASSPVPGPLLLLAGHARSQAHVPPLKPVRPLADARAHARHHRSATVGSASLFGMCFAARRCARGGR